MKPEKKSSEGRENAKPPMKNIKLSQSIFIMLTEHQEIHIKRIRGSLNNVHNVNSNAWQ